MLVVPAVALACLVAPRAAPAVSVGEPVVQVSGERLRERAEALADLVSPEPDWPEDLFHPELFAELSPARVRAVFAEVAASCGAARSVTALEAPEPAPGEARYRVALADGCETLLTVRLEVRAPHRVTAFHLTPPAPVVDDVETLERRLDELVDGSAGRVSLLAARLGEGAPEPLFAREPELRLGVGSAFKLYVLGALVDDVRAGRRAWSDTRTLVARRRSVGAGILHAWPAGSPVTLHTLATLMISQSDNTATDHLVDELGRARVEAMLAVMGHGAPGTTLPLLTTRELFLLRGASGGALAERYLALDEAGRRAFLADVVAPLSVSLVDPARVAEPDGAGRLGWLASAGDLCRALDWLRRATEDASAATARDVLAVHAGPHPGGPGATGAAYLGYKGGTTGGALCHAWLARGRDGTWYAVAAIWNDAEDALDRRRFQGIGASALGLALSSPERSARDE